MEEKILPIEAIQERDIDLILLEELNVDNTFSEWLVKEMNFPKLIKNNGAWKSICDFGLGETDILFSYNSKNKTIYILIENKLDASFQDKQYERYIKRAENYINNGSCDLVFVILIAPKMYCKNQNEFENFLTYEQIVKRFEFIGSKRSLFKGKLFEIASEKLRRGYKPVNSLPVQKFWHSYWKFKEDNFPNLRMKKPGIVPANSDWPMLYDDNLSGIVFYHKLAQGNVDATFKGFPIETEIRIKENLPSDAIFVKHNKSFSIRYFSGKCERMKDFETQKENVRKGLEKMEKLRKWLNENKKDWLQHYV